MEIRKSYVITSKTVAIMPFVAENGELYTVVLEAGAIAIISKPPAKLIQENQQFIVSQQRNLNRVYEDCWEKDILQNGKKTNIKFTIRLDDQSL